MSRQHPHKHMRLFDFQQFRWQHQFIHVETIGCLPPFGLIYRLNASNTIDYSSSKLHLCEPASVCPFLHFFAFKANHPIRCYLVFLRLLAKRFYFEYGPRKSTNYSYALHHELLWVGMHQQEKQWALKFLQHVKLIESKSLDIHI